MNRKEFLQTTLGCAAGCVACASPLHAAEEPAVPQEARDAAVVRGWLSQFLPREEKQLDRAALIKLMEERGRACCLALDFRRKLVQDANGDVAKLVELMGKIVGPQNCQREGNTVTLTYPVDHCVCGWSPKRAPSPDDPYCDCSKANNQRLFEIVSGKPVKVEVTQSQRRTGSPCRFVIHLA